MYRKHLFIAIIVLIVGACQWDKQKSIYVDELQRFKTVVDNSASSSLLLVVDLGCRGCKQFNENNLDQLIRNYIVSKKANLKIAPLSFTGARSQEKSALLKMLEEEVSGQQYLDLYKLAYTDVVFNGGVQEYMRAIVQEGILPGLTENDLMTMFRTSSAREQIVKDKRYLIRSGVRNVPMVLLDGKPLTQYE